MTCVPCKQGWVSNVVDGAVGLVKVAAGVDRTADDVAAARLGACAVCPMLQRAVSGLPQGADVGLADRCASCGCFVRAKVLIASEACPDGRW